MNHKFGRYPENIQFKRYWGARAIFGGISKYRIDIPWDRKTFEGEQQGSEDFVNWVNDKFFEWLLPQANQALYNEQRKILTFDSEDGRFHGEASCQGSYGYLYIGCWER